MAESTRDKRPSIPPIRLTYGKLGIPSDLAAVTPMGSPPALNKSNIERDAILAQIAHAQYEKEVGERKEREAQTFLDGFQGADDGSSMNEARRLAEADLNNSRQLIRLRNEDIFKLRRELDRVNAQRDTGMNRSNSMPSPQSAKKKKGASTHSSVASRSKQVELNSREEFLELQKAYKKERRQVGREILDLEKIIQRSTSEDEKARLKAEIDVLQRKLIVIDEDYLEDQDMLAKAVELERDKILAEVEDEQALSSDEEQQVKRGTYEWVEKNLLEKPKINPPVNVNYDQRWNEQQSGLLTSDYDSPYASARGSVIGVQGIPAFQPVNHTAQPHNHQNLRQEVPPPIAYQSRTRNYQQRCPPPPAGPVAELTSALKDAFREIRGEKEWEPRDLPSFNGKAEDWPIFIGEFNRTTPTGKTNASQNAIRLRKALKGDAREAVVGLLTNPANISKILNILEQRFGRKEFVIEALMDKAEQCKNPDFNKPDTVLTFGSTVQQLVETVKSLGEERYMYDTGLLRRLVSKLPVQQAASWIRWSKSQPTLTPSLGTFGSWIEEEMEINVCIARPKIRDEDAKSTRNARTTRGSARINAVVTEETPSQEKESSSVTTHEKDKCGHCSKTNHRIQRCFSFKKLPVAERVKIAKDKDLCFRCLGSNHLKRNCPSTTLCEISGCQRDHHTLLHLDGKPWKERSKKADEGSVENEPTSEIPSVVPTTSSNIKMIQTKQSKPFSVLKIKVKGPKGEKQVYAMLDNGGDTTIIDADLAKDLGISGELTKHKCHVFGGGVTTRISQKVEFEVAGVYNQARRYLIKGALTSADMGLAPYSQNAEEAKAKWKYLRRAKLKSFKDVVPLVLIGEDHPKVTVHREFLEGADDEPVAKRTMLGWVLGGRKLQEKGSISINAFKMQEDDNLYKLMESNYSLESYGTFPGNVTGSVEDRRCLKIMEETTKRISRNQWECALLWRNENVIIHPGRQEAISRLLRNEAKMKLDPVYGEMYRAKIAEYFQKEYASQLDPEQAAVRNRKTLYIAHFGVSNVNKPGRLRLVFDAASRNGNVGLNENLMTGPDLMRPLPGVLLNFRIHNVAINGDIEDMYHRVAIRAEDRDSQRFVWRDWDNEPVKDCVMNVLLFGSCCSQASAIYVKDKNADLFAVEYPEAVRAIKEDFYSDDCLSGAQSVEEAINLLKQITLINASGNFHVKKWLSNSKEVIAAVPEKDRAVGLKGFSGKEELPLERVLGLWWDPESDCFTFSANFKKVKSNILEGRRPTKREMCGLVMSVFDPLGFLAPFKVKGLMLLQSTWRSGILWDEEIPDSIFPEWQSWVSRLKETENVKINRPYTLDIHLATEIQLHTLVDASEEGTSAVSYLRIGHGSLVTLAFVLGKTKVAPLKKQTIPRLELMAAVMGACQADAIIRDIRVPIKSKVFWSDSKTVLRWIRSETRRFKEFVGNRVNRIHLLTSAHEWKWVPTMLNVADQGTRLRSKVELSPDSSWLKGPGFLLMEPEKWPQESSEGGGETDDEEIRVSKMFTIRLGDSLRINASGNEACGLSEGEAYGIVNMAQFSDYGRMINAQAGVLKAARFWLDKVRKVEAIPPWSLKATDGKQRSLMKRLHESLRTNTDPDAVKRAELLLIRKTQLDAFQDDVIAIQRNGKLDKGSKLRKLSVFLDEGLLKMGGRIMAADTADGMKTPIILPSRHHFTDLLVMKEHQRQAHQGHNTVLVELRRRFWILEDRAAVRRAHRRCRTCIMDKAKPIVPEMGQLPHYRLASGHPPFTSTGVDLMGPLEVTVGRHHEKRWVAVFTCMVTRAVHLEVVHGLSTDETMMAFSRFVDVRRRPHHVYSDNGTNFVGAKKELKENWRSVDWNAIMDCDKFREINWHFSPPYSPHFGGAWERMVQLVKRILRKTLLEKFPKDQLLLTMLKGAENLINGRPLSYASDDPSDLQPLTPNHFLKGFSDVGPNIPGEYDGDDGLGRVQWKRAQHFLDEFWNRWKREVLPEMAKRAKWYDDTKPLEAGDLVLIGNDQTPRNTWKRGIIVETMPDKDGNVRVVRVKAGNTIYKRGVTEIIPLGLKENQGNPAFGGRSVKNDA